MAYSETNPLRRKELFNRQKKVDVLIAKTLDSLEDYEPGTEEYEDRLKVVERLNKLKASGQQRVSWDTIVTVLGQLLGILIVVLHERSHVIVTKAFSIVGKNRA